MKAKKDIIAVSDLYVIEDGFLEGVRLDDLKNVLSLKLSCPLFKGHPDYSHLLNKVRRYFSSGIYLNSDGRKITMSFHDCENLVRDKLDYNEIDISPARIQNWGIEVDNKIKTFKIQSDEENIEFTFTKFEIFESKKIMFSA